MEQRTLLGFTTMNFDVTIQVEAMDLFSLVCLLPYFIPHDILERIA